VAYACEDPEKKVFEGRSSEGLYSSKLMGIFRRSVVRKCLLTQVCRLPNHLKNVDGVQGGVTPSLPEPKGPPKKARINKIYNIDHPQC
jgi:hypothetical protein